MIDYKTLRYYRLNDEQLKIYRDWMIENIESTNELGRGKAAKIENLILIELVSRELDRRTFGGFYAPDIDRDDNNAQ